MLCCYVGVCSIVTCCILSVIMLFIAGSCHSCFACHLQTVHPFPVIFISISTEIISSFQWHTWFSKILPCLSFFSGARIRIAYHIPHIMHVLHHVACAFPVIDCGSIAVFLLWVDPGDELVYEEPVGNAYEDQAFDNSKNLAGKMTIPSKSLLSLLARCSLFCYAYAAISTTCYIMPPILPCQASNHPFLANRCLAKLPLLLSPSYSVACCR